MKSLATKALTAAAILTAFSSTALANAFCANTAIAAAKAVANVNGSVAEISDVNTKDLKTFKVVLFQKNLGEDTYSVTTSGGHDCTVYSVIVKGEPTRVP